MVKQCVYGLCRSDSRYPERLQNGLFFVPFAKKSVDAAKCHRWVEACGRPYDQLNVDKINKYTYICSKHFVGGQGPTAEHPDPIPVDSSEWDATQNSPRRRLRIQPETWENLSSVKKKIVVERLPNYVHTRIEKPYKCEVCGQVYSKLGNLERHTKIHTGGQNDSKVYNCEVCNKSYDKRKRFLYHMKKHTGDMKQYPCDVCNKLLNNSTSLERHLKVHAEEKPFQCGLCQKNFRDKAGLVHHMSAHTGVKPFKCEVCAKRFTQNASLKTHMRIHTGLKPYKCEVCGEMFSSSSHFHKHMRRHNGSGEKPFKCEQCDKMFGFKNALKSHQRIHTGEKPFKCECCGKMFRQISTLLRHKKLHTRYIRKENGNICTQTTYPVLVFFQLTPVTQS